MSTGNSEFDFKAGGLSFYSSSCDWLAVNHNGANAQYEDSGTINGASSCGFMLCVKDLDPDGDDTYRIKIWTETEGYAVV